MNERTVNINGRTYDLEYMPVLVPREERQPILPKNDLSPPPTYLSTESINETRRINAEREKASFLGKCLLGGLCLIGICGAGAGLVAISHMPCASNATCGIPRAWSIIAIPLSGVGIGGGATLYGCIDCQKCNCQCGNCWKTVKKGCQCWEKCLSCGAFDNCCPERKIMN